MHITAAICLILLGLASSSIAVATVTSAGAGPADHSMAHCVLPGGEGPNSQASIVDRPDLLSMFSPVQPTLFVPGGDAGDGVAPPLWAVVLRYSRHDNSDPLEHDVRERIFQSIERSPGTYITELSDELTVTRSTVRYHVRILEDERLVATEQTDGKHRLYPRNSTENPELAAALNDDASARVLRSVARMEPVDVSSLARAIDRSPGTISYHLDRLDEAGLIERERVGNAVHTRLAEEIDLETTGASMALNAD